MHVARQMVQELMLPGRQNSCERAHAKDEVAEPSCEVLMQNCVAATACAPWTAGAAPCAPARGRGERSWQARTPTSWWLC